MADLDDIFARRWPKQSVPKLGSQSDRMRR